MRRPNSTLDLDFEAAGMTHRGKVRDRNEDSFGVRGDLGLFLVADGIASCPGGEIASSLAIRSIERFFERSRRRSPLDLRHPQEERDRLVRAIRSANDRIAAAAALDPQRGRMGTTLVALAVAGRRAVLAHVGDSRVYRLRGGRLERLTKDHSVAEDEAFRAENPDEPDLHDPTKQQMLTEVLGRDEPYRIATRIEPVRHGDLLLLCTDGVHGLLRPEEIVYGLRRYRRAPKPPDVVLTNARHKQAWALIKIALNFGGYDNITAVVVRFTRRPASPA